MPVFTFSTKTKRPEDTELVERIKEHCDKHNLNFSGVVLKQLKQFEADNGRTNEV